MAKERVTHLDESGCSDCEYNERGGRNRVAIPRRMTLDRLDLLIRNGYGQGRNQFYEPWIRIRRRLSSPVSNLVALSTPLYARRSLHLLSGLEDRAAQLALWLGAAEIREQFPMWPDPHLHPIVGISRARDRLMHDVPGLLEIARNSGIDHGTYPGTRIPFVATVDLLIRMGSPPDDFLVLWGCKPLELMLEPGKNERRLERLELERLYSIAIGARSIVFDGTEASRRFFANLDWFRPLHAEVAAYGQSNQLQDFAGQFLAASRALPIRECVAHCGRLLALNHDSAHRFFRMAAWLGLIDIDFTQSIVMSRPLRRDGGGTAKRLRALLLGC
jgi:hypothetical protein